MRFIRFKKVLEAEKEMTKVKLNLNQTHCCGIYSDKTVYRFTGDSYQELFYLLQRRGLIESFIDGDFIVFSFIQQKIGRGILRHTFIHATSFKRPISMSLLSP